MLKMTLFFVNLMHFDMEMDGVSEIERYPKRENLMLQPFLCFISRESIGLPKMEKFR